jgi:ATP-dependent helicase Lhr and Lhr-like helicase
VIGRIEAWFESRGWTVFDFQRQTWDAYQRGESGLVHAPTGMGKTYAVGLGALLSWAREMQTAEKDPETVPPQILWITPLRALAADTLDALRAPLQALRIPWTVELRTGDTSTSLRQRQRTRPPTVLITTPENVSLMLSYPETRQNFKTLPCVIVDEWHELLGTKRGVQAELALARLRSWNPALRIWGLSATLGNTAQAMDVLLGGRPGTLISAALAKDITIESLLPADMAHFPWAGHMGLVMLPQVIRTLEQAKSTLLFTNTRSQAEMWYRALLLEKPEWSDRLALHHGSLERDLRKNVERQLHAGEMTCVVCTSNLDLGVDFSPVDQVIQLGAPKGVARLLQRAGRSGHQPGRPSRIVCVPTQALELMEFAAVRDAAGRREIESRLPMRRALDVLVQHLVTVALGGGFDEKALSEEVKTTYAYRDLSALEWRWAMDFVTRGGPALRAYPQYAKVTKRDGLYRVESRPIARLHRLSIGTITSDSMLRVQFLKGATLGTIEESFIARLKPREAFSFAGQVLELIQIKDMTAYVRRANRHRPAVPRWMGGRLPLSTELAAAMRRKLDDAKHGRYDGPEMEAIQPVLELQAAGSVIPAPDELLIETCHSREGFHVYLFPFQGRLVHQGLVALLAYRLARALPQTIRITANDYGMELLSRQPWSLGEEDWRRHLSTERLAEDLLDCLNATEMARRRFRDIARVAGLIFQGYPGAGKTTKQLQASSALFFDVFTQYDPDNKLLDQARREVLEAQLEYARMKQALEAISAMRIVRVATEKLSPLAFPIYSEGLQQSEVSTERWAERLQRMALERRRIDDVAAPPPLESTEAFEARWKRQAARVPRQFGRP